MCVPILAAGAAILGGIAVKKTLDKAKAGSAPAGPDPEAERLAAEAEATKNANAKLVDLQRRRRMQSNLLAQADEWAAGGVPMAPGAAPSAGGGLAPRTALSRAGAYAGGGGVPAAGGSRQGQAVMIQ